MKRVMFLVVLLLVATTCFAQLQSPPSNVTGYVKFTAVGNNGYTAFGLPFRFWDVPSGGVPAYGVNTTDPEDILGDQLTCGTIVTSDKVIKQAGDQAYRRVDLGCAWTGPLQINHGMEVGRAYWVQNKTASARDIVVAGEVDNSGNYDTLLVASGANAYTALSWRDSRSVDRDDLNLMQAGFLGGTVGSSDQVLLQGGGGFFWRRNTDNTWQGTLVTVEPGRAYWILNRVHGNGAWNYTYNASGATLSRGDNGPKNNDAGAPVSKVRTTPAVKANVGTRN